MVSELSRQLMHDLLEYDWVYVLAKHVYEEPVPEPGLLDDDIDAFFLDQPEPDIEQISSHSGREHYESSIH